VNISDGGALVEGSGRLLPGTHMEVHVVTRDGRVLVRARIVRAHVSRLEREAVGYCGALAFERLVDTAPRGYGVPVESPNDLAPGGSVYPAAVARDES
jgi:hypothetical protein